MVAAVRDTDIAHPPRLPPLPPAHHLRRQSAQAPSTPRTSTSTARKLDGQPEQRPRWKRCSTAVDGALGEALGQVYVEQYFAGDSKAKTLEMVHDIEAAMDRDIDTLDWMSPATKVKAKEKLHAVADKIGYPDHWRDYSKLTISPDRRPRQRRARHRLRERPRAQQDRQARRQAWSGA